MDSGRLDTSSIPFHNDRGRFVPISVPTLVCALLLGLFIAGCAANRNAQDDQQQPETAQGEQPQPDSSDVRPAAQYPGSDVGERLGRLDAMMRTASPDTVPYIKAEYQRILDSIALARREPIYTGGPDSTPPISPVVTGPIDTTRLTAVDTTAAATDSLELIRDPSKLYKGLRQSELRRIPGYEPPARTRTPRAAATPRTGGIASRDLAAGRKTSRARRAPQNTEQRSSRPREVAADSRKMMERKTVNGIAADQAGRYNEAVQQLAPAVKSGKTSPRARYSYANSLENTGQLSKAASEYLKLSRSGGALGHKAYVAYCRLLARMGQKSRAKQLVLQFIERHPDSSQVVTARRLLQTL
jgi:TolA-binding protein